MRWSGLVALLVACGNGGNPPPPTGGVSLVLDIPNGALDPKGYTNVEVVLHEQSGDITRSANLGPNNTFNLGSVDPTDSVWVEATLRNDSGAAVGYGRTGAPAAFAAGTEIVVPVRRPIIYVAGLVSQDADGNPNTPGLTWSEVPATFSDLSVGTTLDGTSTVGSQAELMISAGPNLYMVEQAVMPSDGTLMGAATIKPVSMVDHQIQAALAGSMTGSVLDGAGTDDGTTLVIGTSTQLFAVDTTTGNPRSLMAGSSGSFNRVAIVSIGAGEIDAIAIKNRGSTAGACISTAELWWVPLVGGETGGARMIATGGFSDVAADRGHAYYIDACKGELGEATAMGIKSLRTGLAKPTALAVSNGQAYIGIEKSAPATTGLLVASVSTMDPPRALWTETARQVLNAIQFPGVERELDASSVVFNHLEVGAGGDYVAISTSAHFHGASIAAANFPDMTIDTDELRVFDASNGAVVQRYRSWCDGVLLINIGDIDMWACATSTGQTAPTNPNLEHHISSLTFLFGKK